MSSAGLWMLTTLAVLVIATGLPAWALLIGTSSLFGLAGVLTGQVDPALLGALPGRLVGLLENDLLQALPLYAFIGLLLQRLTMARNLHALLTRAARRTGAAPALATLGVAALVAPMNGSVAASASMLTRLVGPRLGGVAPARALALMSASAALGVVVPPSLVLLLLGDAMLNAHTEAVRLPWFAGTDTARIVNTQDILRAALVPALLVLAGWALVAWRQARTGADDAPTLSRGARLEALAVIAAVALLVTAVFTGVVRAVEAAATAGCLAVAWALVSRELKGHDWRELLSDSLSLSGALFALLVGATTFSLVFRAWGTDQWLGQLAADSPLGHHATAALLLGFVGLCAPVLDAFEMIFVVVPILAPPLIAHLGDARQAAVLLLLVLQLGFLLPPLGYAVLMTRALSGLAPMSLGSLVRGLAPYLAVPLLVLVAAFGWPALVHLLDGPGANAAAAAPALPEDEVERLMREMAPAPDPVAPPAQSQ